MARKNPILFSSSSFAYLSLITFLILILDQVSKFLALSFLTPGVSSPVIKGIFHLTLVYNRGAAFGLFRGGALFFTLASIICIIAISFLWKNDRLFSKILGLNPKDRMVRFSLALILGGACGNLIDRVRFFSVIDFLDFRIWPVFNLADSAITIGALFICFSLLKKHKRT